ncbi:MAG TPA: hypothetical protein VF795_11475 [Desulfuromonadaceae bacterium]
MEQHKADSGLLTLDGCRQLSVIESTILSMLQHHTYLAGQIIDIPRLQEECEDGGLSTTEFSHGFVSLLTRRLVEPRGEFTFSLSAEGNRLKEAICRRKGGTFPEGHR